MVTEEWLRTLLHVENIQIDFIVPKVLAIGMRYVLITNQFEIQEVLISSDQETGQIIGMCLPEGKESYIEKDLPSAGLLLYCIRGRKGRTSQLLMMSILTVVMDRFKTAQTTPESLPCEEKKELLYD